MLLFVLAHQKSCPWSAGTAPEPCWERIGNEEISLSDGALNGQGTGGGALSWELWGPTDQGPAHSSQRWPRQGKWALAAALSILLPSGRLCLLMGFGGWWEGSCSSKSCSETLTWHSEHWTPGRRQHFAGKKWIFVQINHHHYHQNPGKDWSEEFGSKESLLMLFMGWNREAESSNSNFQLLS